MKHEAVDHLQRSPRVLSTGAQPDAMFSSIRAAASTQPAEEESRNPVNG